MTDRSIYISYHRRFSCSIALALFHALRAAGFDVYLNAGSFDERDAVDLAQIDARAHFLVIMTPALIDTLQTSDEPMCHEIERAVAQRRNVVPLLANGFVFGTSLLPQAIATLRRYYALALTPESFDQTIAVLTTERLVTEIFGVLLPTPPEHADAVQKRTDEALRLTPPTADDLRTEVAYNHSQARNRQDLAGKIADLDDVLRLSPRHVDARYDRAVARRRSGDESGAVEDYDMVIRLEPQFYKAYNNRAELYFAHKAYSKALADYERATALYPSFVMSQAGKALTLHALGRVDEAVRLWQSLAARDERFNDALWVGRELRLPTAMIDEIRRLTQRLAQDLTTQFHAPDD